MGLSNIIWRFALKSDNLWIRFEAMQHIKKSGDIELLKTILRENVKVPGEVRGVWHSSMSDVAFDYFRNEYDTIPEDVIGILFNNLNTPDSSVRREVYENLGRAYKKSTDQCKIKILNILRNGLIEERVDPARLGVEEAISFLEKAIPFDDYKKMRIPILISNLARDRYVAELISLIEADAAPILQNALASPNYEIRQNAKWGLRTLETGLYFHTEKW
jgi:hypothetical protein